MTTATVIEQLLQDLTAVEEVARQASGRANGRVHVTDVLDDVVPVTNLTTAGLARVRGRIDDAAGDAPWSVVVKVVQTPTRSRIWARIPSELQATALVGMPWRSEAEIYASALRTQLPVGLRMPHVYRVDEIDDGSMAIWTEDVAHDAGPWALDDYRRAGGLLGRMAGRHRGVRAGLPVRVRTLRGYLHGPVRRGALPLLADDAVWSHPLIAASAPPRLRADMAVLDAAADALLDRLDALPQALAHGDAAPQNLLRSSDGELVAVDWQFVGICAVGFDGGQVLAGHAESGDLERQQLEPTLSAIVEAYTAGVHAEGADVSADDVRVGALGTLVIRSGFTALPLELLGDPTPELAQLFVRRAGFAQLLTELAQTL